MPSGAGQAPSLSSPPLQNIQSNSEKKELSLLLLVVVSVEARSSASPQNLMLAMMYIASSRISICYLSNACANSHPLTAEDIGHSDKSVAPKCHPLKWVCWARRLDDQTNAVEFKNHPCKNRLNPLLPAHLKVDPVLLRSKYESFSKAPEGLSFESSHLGMRGYRFRNFEERCAT